MNNRKSLSQKIPFFEIVLFFIFFIFSSVIMWKTFEVSNSGNMLISTKVWSDFAATIPLIRSFSYGDNFPPEYPLFSGPNIRYHFFFYWLVGMLEKSGIPIDWALNIPSSVGFTFLLVSIYLLGKTVFNNRAVGLLSVVFFILNGSFSFLEFFKNHPLSPETPLEILNNASFPSFGPYDGKIVSAFWSLNIYTNQRHLSLGYSLLLFLIFILFYLENKPKMLSIRNSIALGVLLGLLPFIHLPVFGMAGITLLGSLVIFPKIRYKVFLIGICAFVIAIPQILYMGSSQIKTELLSPGYLVNDKNIFSFLEYWFLNLGISTILSPLGFYLATKRQRKIFVFFVFFFLIGNIFKFSPEVAANHKFFNVSVIGINMFTALFISRAWQSGLPGKVACGLYLPLMTISGIIDLPPIFNDTKMEIVDTKNSETVRFILKNTEKDSVFLNSSYLYDPASLAGRKIFMGWPYFSWSAGYDTSKREAGLRSVINKRRRSELCAYLKKESVDYIETKDNMIFGEQTVNMGVGGFNFVRVYESRNEGVRIYDVNLSCP